MADRHTCYSRILPTRSDDEELVLGSQPGEGRWIDLNENMPGVSRRHCSLQMENGQCVMRDFSRYGSFLNGHAIDGSAVLQVGDLVRLGTPGFRVSPDYNGVREWLVGADSLKCLACRFWTA